MGRYYLVLRAHIFGPEEGDALDGLVDLTPYASVVKSLLIPMFLVTCVQIGLHLVASNLGAAWGAMGAMLLTASVLATLPVLAAALFAISVFGSGNLVAGWVAFAVLVGGCCGAWVGTAAGCAALLPPAWY
jgi:hypothetical protein